MNLTHREKAGPLPPQFQFAPLGKALLDSFREGVVVFDAWGRVLHSNQEARRVLGGEIESERADTMLPRLAALGARIMPLKVSGQDAGAAAFIPPRTERERPRTLAERERQAILDTLEQTHGRLAETARRLGISRTTLWRRLKAYGVRVPDNGHREAKSA